MTASGSDQLSYWAASTRKTSTTARMKTYKAVLPVWICNSASSVQAVCIDWRSPLSVASCSSRMAAPELTPGAGSALTAAAGYML